MTNFDRVVGLMGASVVAIACASPALAQTRTYSIPAQSASSGVASLARQSDQQVLISARDAKGKKTREVRGEMTIEQAFAKLLAGSGLTAKRTGAGAWAVVQGGNGDAAPVRGEPPEASAQVTVVAPAGAVVDARTGAALKGALVEIVETGETASTGQLGEFRFPGKTGSFNLRVSYLGYPSYEQYVELKDGRATTGILLTDGGSFYDIVVTAPQSARAQALNQERTADNSSTVVSADLLGQFDGTTISEALRRSPGIAFEIDPRTGDGQNIIVRGLGSSFNTITLNGLRVPVSDGENRSPSLSTILADSVSQITINKTLLPSQDGSGTGGLVDIITKGPLDRPNRYFSVSADKAKSGKSFLDENSLSGTASFRMGSEKNFGISLSAQYRKREINYLHLDQQSFSFGRYSPPANETPVNPARIFPFEPGVDELFPTALSIGENRSNVENLAFTASAQWQIGDRTNLRLDFNHNRSTSDFISNGVNFLPSRSRVALPLDELNGEVREAELWENAFGPGRFASSSRTLSFIEDQKERMSNVSFTGHSDAGAWSFDYKAGYAKATSSSPKNFSATFSNYALSFDDGDLSPELLASTVNGLTRSAFLPADGRTVGLPGLSAAGFAKLNDPSAYGFDYASFQSFDGGNERITGSLDIKRTFQSKVLKYLQAGMFYERSESISNAPISNFYFGSGTMADSGIGLTEGSLDSIGRRANINTVSSEDFFRYYQAFSDGSLPLTIFPLGSDPLSLQDSLVENDYAGYLQAFLKFGKLELVGGVRMEHVRTTANAATSITYIGPDGILDQALYDSSRMITPLSASDTTFLPRATANYRFNENLVLRAGYYLSIARPNIRSLGGPATVLLHLLPFYGPSGNQPGLIINRSNPGLRPAMTHNLDVSLEWYFGNVGALKLGAFYKPTKNAFFSVDTPLLNGIPSDIELPDDPRFQNLDTQYPNLYIGVQRPQNDTKLSKIWGVEFSLERRLSFLPGLLSGLGVFANYTYTHSERTGRFPFFNGTGVEQFEYQTPYSRSAPHSGTAALTYSKGRVDGSLSYSYQSSYLASWAPNGRILYQEPVDSLDFKIQYKPAIAGADARIYVEASNLLKGTADPGTETSQGIGGTPKGIASATYFGGRSLRAGLSLSF